MNAGAEVLLWDTMDDGLRQEAKRMAVARAVLELTPWIVSGTRVQFEITTTPAEKAEMPERHFERYTVRVETIPQ